MFCSPLARSECTNACVWSPPFPSDSFNFLYNLTCLMCFRRSIGSGQVIRALLSHPVQHVTMKSRNRRSSHGMRTGYPSYHILMAICSTHDIITGDPETLGSMFVPIILGSDKTTVSVATRNNEYYPLYLSIGNVHNNVQRAHQDAVAIIGFLAMHKTTKEYAEDLKFHAFRRQLFHSLLSHILETLRPGMTKPEVVKFGDGHFRWVIYGLGPYIADYKEQVLLACIVSRWCPRCCAHCKDLDTDALLQCHDHTEALVDTGTYTQLWFEFGIISNLVVTDIYHLIAPDLLHQVIKGAFKDHLVAWVELYIMKMHGKRDGLCILDDIEHRIVAVASFAGLRRFLQGRGFKQWMGDDSKALMKVYLATIEGHVPQDIVQFCYLVRRNTITESTLDEIEDALSHYHHYRAIFTESGTIPTFLLPRQHSLVQYAYLIQQFGAPNRLCSSITESKHIKAIKEPWRHSSKYKVLGQMLVTNQRLDKLAAACVDFTNRGMLDNTCLAAELEALICKTLPQHDKGIGLLHGELVARNLWPDNDQDPAEIPLAGCPRFAGKISIFNSASSRFYAPSDIIEHIRACPLWRNEAPRNDCIFINMGSIARVHAFFSFKYSGENFPCTIMRWFDVIRDSPDEDTGMWMVCPAIIHVDTIYRAAHLIPIYSRCFLPPNVNLHVSYDSFWAYYVNKFVTIMHLKLLHNLFEL
ncbi:hypothetical protein EDB19DRAFT_1897097 [Suillus lakei]|nr:hypothetical protein EDB19DRAFT_1897097 [Suillus lakei]